MSRKFPTNEFVGPTREPGIFVTTGVLRPARTGEFFCGTRYTGNVPSVGSPLHLTHVLITRPLEAALQLAVSLQDQPDGLKLQALVMPLYTFAAHVPSPDMCATWSVSSGRKLAIFTSPRAVHYGLCFIAPEQLTQLEFVAVGPATRAQLEAAGHTVHLQANSGFTSEDLLQLPALASEPGEAVIFCAPGGRKTLEQGLKSMGWSVNRTKVYERVTVQPPQDQIDQLLGADSLLSIWSSVSALELAEQNLPGEAWGKILNSPALVISARIQHYLQQRGCGTVLLADGPSNRQLLDSIRRLTGVIRVDQNGRYTSER